RSRRNVPFFLADESRNEAFLAGAKARGLMQLKGHKSVGGMRASIYNAVPLEGVKALVGYMKEFEQDRAGRARPGAHGTSPIDPIGFDRSTSTRLRVDFRYGRF